MTTLTITSKGQITLRKELLHVLGVGPGEQIDVVPTPRGGLELIPTRPKRPISDLFGMLKSPLERPLTIEEINDGIAQGAVDEYLRSIGTDPDEKSKD
ncbi:AbrB/MazE/SpoVT family DNA-binding domain-containing protein [Brevundimonas sp.]|jgi:bifunctional DNA-binding transcriptional regulator/antitoxin component of YhaV-PrlF toxin-antitoxin module|uniref:AbrB/MazE/SpoVT family DNA-binding domain-containing protein n=1 Tax=Brevundimonas sp. TaxID=1871086 RepID=UPI002E14ECD5|nr:AbrB/MazE/SpoVT family DNA-binding domain-containing protein [Brevundimonas sp.]